ncbi:AAA family ATPase [Methylobacterium sp. 37f]|uniref:AAA family ATPase n=1 Tax=Methylobacterium sp. 37f TaxID=2817058 RepID=UPI001FFD256E|nr:AAA family ATPase [Methylobacterium sp. 37f]MCK2055284.1 AAA family ATPase [Methylobacterium sp. 37f]
MSKTDRAAVMAGYVAAVRKKLTSYSEPRLPSLIDPPHSTLDLLSGAEFVGSDACRDIEEFLTPLIEKRSPHRFPLRLERSIKSVLTGPDVAKLRILEHGCMLALERHDRGQDRMLAETRQVVVDLSDRTAVWAAALGCARSASRCAVMCFEAWRRRPASTYVDVTTHGLMVSMLEFLGAAAIPSMTADAGYIPEARHVQLQTVRREVAGLVHVLGIVQAAMSSGPVADEPPYLDDLAGLSGLDADVLEDRAGIARRPGAHPLDDLSGDDLVYSPGVVVVASVEHLPTAGSKGSNNPAEDVRKIVGKRIPLTLVPDNLAAVRTELVGESPHTAPVIDGMLRPLVGQSVVRLPPVLLVGPPGCGKTRLSRRVGEVLGVPTTVHSLGGSMDAMFQGVSRGWSTGKVSTPLREIMMSGCANPLLVLDEIDKIGSDRHNGNVLDVLVNMLERESSCRYMDVYLDCPTDLSHVNFVITANTLAGIPKPLLDRCLVLRVPDPGPEHLGVLASRILGDLAFERNLDLFGPVPPLDAAEIDALHAHWPRGGSLRALRRLVGVCLDARDAGPRH